MERDDSSSHYGQPDNSSFSSNRGNPTSDNHDRAQTFSVSSVLRIMREALPKDAKMRGEAKEATRSCVVEFIGLITYEANEHCKREQRRTISSEDLIWAMSSLGFDTYAKLLTFYLQRFRENNNAVVTDECTLGGALPYGDVFVSMGRDASGGASGARHGSGADSGGDEGVAKFDPPTCLNCDRFL